MLSYLSVSLGAFFAGTCVAWMWCQRRTASAKRALQATHDAMLKEQAERTAAWEQLGQSTLPLVQVLNAQMKSVIEQTEQAATDLGQRMLERELRRYRLSPKKVLESSGAWAEFGTARAAK